MNQKIYYGYYSEKQLETIKKTHDKPYIYYTDINDKIVQVTEVTTSSSIDRAFNDIIQLGRLKNFYTVSEVPLKDV